MKDGKVEKWERGVNRIADVKNLARTRNLVKSQNQTNGNKYKPSGFLKNIAVDYNQEDSNQLELEDQWESYRL